MGFNDVANKVDFVELEKNILEFWRQQDAFNKEEQQDSSPIHAQGGQNADFAGPRKNGHEQGIGN